MTLSELTRTLEAGDVVRITTYMVGLLATGGPWHDATVEGKEFIVTHRYQRPTDPAHVWRLCLRRLHNDPNGAPRSIIVQTYDDGLNAMELVRKGRGVAIPGEDYELTEGEKKELRWRAFEQKLLGIDWSYNGYSNAATYLAALYLRNERAWHDTKLPSLRRKDGSLNPNRVEKAFTDLGLKVDDWAFGFPIDIPTEFANYALGRYRPKVNWQEVADEFKST